MEVLPVTPDTWPALEHLFTARGGPHFCWCAPYRFSEAGAWDRAQKRDALLGQVQAGTPVGLLALDGDEPVGWCSVAPRETYARLARSRTMPRSSDQPTWTVLCFFVPRARRKQGVSLALLNGAARHAAEQGAVFLEGYPYDTAGVSATHRGRSELFRAAGFRQEGTRWVLGPLGSTAAI